eukprot:TRINITY_DN2825_c0_g1_i3.p1 TRINITY_DN2825_c0_g1~~TRINITY_DN2825_c0_g1_i3.p1  ORF type:complete len:485 (+),score=73.74 TRINITY_DN2825_c0_g1_i3:107-1561(+)
MARSPVDVSCPLLAHEPSSSSPSSSSYSESWYLPRRYIMVLLCFLGLVLCYSYRVILSVAIIVMNEEYGWSSEVHGLVLSSFFWGYIITQMPAGFLCDKFGGKNVLGAGIALAGAFTIITPFTASSLPLLLLCRCMTGIVEGVAYPTVHWLMARWAHENERSRFVTLVWSGGYIGTVVSMYVSPLIIVRTSWPYLFYGSGALGILWGIIWFIMAASSPSEHRFIRKSEVDYLSINSVDDDHNTTLSSTSSSSSRATGLHDFLLLLRSVHSWAIITNHFGSNWGFYILLTWLPTYMNNVLHFDMSKSVFLSVLPFLTMAVTSTIGGFVADRLLTWGIANNNSKESISINTYDTHQHDQQQVDALAFRKTVVRKVFGCMGLTIAAGSLVAVNYVHSANVVVACVIIALGGTGLSLSGYAVNHLDIAPMHAGVLMGMSNTIATIPGIVGVFLVGIMSWVEVFYVAAAIYMFAVIMWLLFATGRKIFH